MIKHANKILYVGAGCHIEPVTHFPLTKTFIFIDTQPRSEFDTYHPQFNYSCYRPRFINDLIATCEYYRFELESYTVLDKKYHKQIISNSWYFLSWIYKIPPGINPTMLVFTNNKTKQKLTYYISTNIKFNMNHTLRHDIATSDGIIISGYLPESDILQYFVKSKVFFGYTNTSYNTLSDISTNDTIIHFLYNCICNTPYYFKEFYMVYHDSGVIIKCQDFKNFLTSIKDYDNFVLL